MTKPRRFNPYRVFNGSVIPEAVCRVPITKLSHGAKITYGRLIRYAGERGYAFPKQKTTSKEIGTSTRSVKQYTKELVDFGLIDVDQRGKKRSNVYFFLWHRIFDEGLKSEVQNPAPCEVQNPALPYEESQGKRVKKAGTLRVPSSGATNARSHMDYEVTPTDEEGNEVRPRSRAKREPRNKVALRLQFSFRELAKKYLNTSPVPDVAGYNMVLFALNPERGNLSEAQVLDLFDEWFKLGKSDDETVSITRALSARQIEGYKVRNNISN